MKFDPQKTIFLIDGSSFLYRAYYSLRPLHTKEGVPVQAVYSFCRMIKKLINTFHPEYLVLVWDSKGKTTRHELYHDYKATRQAPPSDLFDQKVYIQEFAALIGLAQVAQAGTEADDIMYSLACDLSQESDTVVFVTSDKDMGQALTEKIVMFDPFKDTVLDRNAFEEKTTIPVSKLPFYYALVGDSSDNIPGVRGIGPKGATDLVHQFASLEDLYEKIDQVSKPRTKQALLDNKENAFLSKKLFLLQYQAFNLAKTEFAFNRHNWQKADPLFIQLGFTSLLDKDAAQPIASQQKKTDYAYKTITTRDQLHALCAELQEKKEFALDTETDGLRPLQATFVGISFCVEYGTAYYIPCGHKTTEQQLGQQEVLEALKPILENDQYKKYLHHAKFDQLVLYAQGINLAGIEFDTLVAAKLILKSWQRIGLKYLSEYYFNEPMLSFEQIVTKQKLKDFSYVSLAQATEYGAADAHQTFRLVAVLKQELEKEGLMELYKTIELPLVQVLFAMEAKGIHLNLEVMSELDKRVTHALQKIEQEIINFVSDEFKGINLNSPRQVEQLLFHELKLPPQKKSAKRTGYSTDQEVLEFLADQHIVPGLILKYRELFKLKSTYIDALPLYVNPKTGRIHTTYNQIAVATGRLASSEPNLQNIPTNGSGYGKVIRSAFEPEKGHMFLSADYSQIELRVLAYFSQDRNLLQAFWSHRDIHAQTAAGLFNVPLEQVTNEQRQIGKRINFSILYGLTPFGLSKDLKIPFSQAKHYIEKYFEQYPSVLGWMEQVVDETKKQGYVETFKGRRRYIPGIYEKNRSLYEEARRVAINTKAQGTAAEIMKMGMIELEKAFNKEQLGAQILLQIHDELLISVKDGTQEQVTALTKHVLEGVVDWSVPLEISTRLGKDWQEVSK